MGRLFDLVSAAAVTTATTAGRTVGIRSPWSTGELSRVVWSDVFGVAAMPVTRAEAMALPAVARGRHLLAGSIGQLPLRAYRGAELVDPQPAWLARTNGATSPQHRLVWTVDDLVFRGWSLWAVERGREGLADAVRVPLERWRFDDGAVVVTNDAGVELPVDDDTVVLIPGFHEGILAYGSRTIRSAHALEAAWAGRARNPIPAVELHQTSEVQLTDDEIDAMLAEWRAARADPDGAVTYTPHDVELRVHGESSADLLVEGRNAAAIDCARMLGIPAAMLDASNVNASLTYETIAGRSLEFRDYSLSLYTAAIASRLSLDDVTPRGTRIAFDYTEWTAANSPTGPHTAD